MITVHKIEGNVIYPIFAQRINMQDMERDARCLNLLEDEEHALHMEIEICICTEAKEQLQRQLKEVQEQIEELQRKWGW